MTRKDTAQERDWKNRLCVCDVVDAGRQRFDNKHVGKLVIRIESEYNCVGCIKKQTTKKAALTRGERE